MSCFSKIGFPSNRKGVAPPPSRTQRTYLGKNNMSNWTTPFLWANTCSAAAAPSDFPDLPPFLHWTTLCGFAGRKEQTPNPCPHQNTKGAEHPNTARSSSGEVRIWVPNFCLSSIVGKPSTPKKKRVRKGTNWGTLGKAPFQNVNMQGPAIR